MQTETLIVGGGLAGLSLAAHLSKRGHDFQLVEARPRLGGRISTIQHAGGTFDMGPAWFWPGQPRIAALIKELGLTRFDQFCTGDLMFENEQGIAQRGKGFASMEGSYRLAGGLTALIDGLSTKIDAARLQVSSPIQELSQHGDHIKAAIENGGTITAHRVVLALPPRLAAQFRFRPALADSALQAMQSTATWMAGHAKAVAIYDHPFWRDAGLSGDAMSRFGPLAEIHDASPAAHGPYALFGFLGVPPQARTDEAALKKQIMVQLTRLYGPDASAPINLTVKDWAFDPFTATQLDQRPLYSHPDYGLPTALTGLWDNRLIFGGTEVATAFGGYLEGALEAAENALRQVAET